MFCSKRRLGFILEQWRAVESLQTGKTNQPSEDKRMHRIPSIERIRELKEEIGALVKLNALYKTDSNRSEVTLKADVCRGVRLMEIREELGAMKRLR